VPEPLRKEKQRQNAHNDDKPNKKESPVHKSNSSVTKSNCNTLVLADL
jgi:hypothetical protein